MFLAQLLCVFFLYIAWMGVGFVSTGTQARASLACTKAAAFSCCTRQDAAPVERQRPWCRTLSGMMAMMAMVAMPWEAIRDGMRFVVDRGLRALERRTVPIMTGSIGEL